MVQHETNSLASAKAEASGTQPAAHPRWATTGILAACSSLALAISLPPCHFSPAIWLAPLGWLLIVRLPRLEGKRPYFKLWAASLTFWLFYLWGIRNAHVALYAGWIALSAYVAIYAPLFVGLSRYLVHQRRLPMIVATPLVWMLLEIARGYLFSGFAVGLLGHALVNSSWLIQIADLGGAYLVSGMIVLVASGLLESVLPAVIALRVSWKYRLLHLAVVAGTLLLAAGYSTTQLRKFSTDVSEHASATARQPSLRIALVQESLDTVFDGDPERSVEMFRRYRDYTRTICEQDRELDLVVWPESAFTANIPDQLLDDPTQLKPPPGFEDRRREYQEFVRARSIEGPRKAQSAARTINPAEDRQTFLIAGSDTIDYRTEPPRIYNSALLVSPEGAITDRYFKQHPVMFGEYVPLAEHIPLLAQITPIGAGIASGQRPQAFSIHGFCISPSICFESTVPHLIRRQVTQLIAEGKSPDALVNLTNDGWFWGSSILDMHFHCAVFRAIENRRPVLIAANTGLSGWIDAAGTIVQQAPRRQPKAIVAEVVRHEQISVYMKIGDVGVVTAALAVLLIAAVVAHRRQG